MNQKLYPDPYGRDTWKKHPEARLYVHIVNSALYHEITGNPPPESPISAEIYTRYGYPWYSLYDEAYGDVPTSETLTGVKSVNEIEARNGCANPIRPRPSIEIAEELIIGIPIDPPKAVNDGRAATRTRPALPPATRTAHPTRGLRTRPRIRRRDLDHLPQHARTRPTKPQPPHARPLLAVLHSNRAELTQLYQDEPWSDTGFSSTPRMRGQRTPITRSLRQNMVEWGCRNTEDPAGDDSLEELIRLWYTLPTPASTSSYAWCARSQLGWRLLTSSHPTLRRASVLTLDPPA